MLTFQDLLEALNGLAKRHITAFQTGKLSCYEERLR